MLLLYYLSSPHGENGCHNGMAIDSRNIFFSRFLERVTQGISKNMSDTHMATTMITRDDLKKPPRNSALHRACLELELPAESMQNVSSAA